MGRVMSYSSTSTYCCQGPFPEDEEGRGQSGQPCLPLLQKKGALKEIEVEWEMNDNSADAALAAIIAAFIGDTPLAFLIKDASDGLGIDGDFKVFGCDREEKLEDAVVYKINIKPCPSTRDVQWV